MSRLFRGLPAALVLAACALPLSAEETPAQYERQNLSPKLGERVTLSLREGTNGRWETRVVTRDLVELVTEKRAADALEIVLRMRAEGRGRFEAVLVRENRVARRVYWFLDIGRAAADGARTNTRPDGKDGKDGAETADQRDYDYAQKLFGEGYYDEARRVFRIFRARNPQSALVGMSWVLEGQAAYELGKHREAVSALANALRSPDDRTRLLASLWTGYAQDALGLAAASESFLAALSGGQQPDIEAAARAGLARHYAKRGQARLAVLQYELLFREAGKDAEKQPAYALAVFHAADFYDRTPSTRDVDRAYKYYRQYLRLAAPFLAEKKAPAYLLSQLARARATAVERAAYLRKNFIDYR